MRLTSGVPSSRISEDGQSSPEPHLNHTTHVQQVTNTHLNTHPPTPIINKKNAPFHGHLFFHPRATATASTACTACCLLLTVCCQRCLLPGACCSCFALLCFSTDLPRACYVAFQVAFQVIAKKNIRRIAQPTRCVHSMRASAPWRACARACAHVWVVVHGWWCARACALWRACLHVGAWCMARVCLVHGARVLGVWRVAWCMARVCLVHGARVLGAWRACAWCMARVLTHGCLARVLMHGCLVHGARVLGVWRACAWCMARVCLVHGARVLGVWRSVLMCGVVVHGARVCLCTCVCVCAQMDNPASHRAQLARCESHEDDCHNVWPSKTWKRPRS